MALEIAPAPAKPAAPAAAGNAKSSAAATDKGKTGKEPADFLALLLGIDLEQPSDLPPDGAALTAEKPDPDAKDADADPLTALPLVAALPQPDVQLPTAAAVPLAQHPQGLRADAPVDAGASKVTLDLADKPAAARRRAPADGATPLGTQALQQTEPAKETANKLADMASAREAVRPAVVEAAPQPVVVAQTPVAGEEARKATHGLQAKVEIADNLALLSSGLSGAIATSSPGFDVSAPGAVAQFQSVVADEVAYYVSQDIQSAEMKLEGVGGGPVEVSINMQGKEAQVVFRTDEVQTRAMLEGASTQLKDMLQQQGVVLTGVYVGTSGAGSGGEADGGERRRPGGRGEAGLRVTATEIQGASGRSQPQGVGRTLDLYV